MVLYVFIVNTNAGNGKAIIAWNRVEVILKQRKIPYIYQLTTSSEEASNFVRDHVVLKPYDKLIVVGGDGTVQSILSEIVERPLSIGIIPTGSGNDFARSMGVPLQVDLALEYILSGSARKMDILFTDGRYCMTIIGVGLDGMVAKVVNEAWYKRWLQKIGLADWSYILGFVSVLFRYKPGEVSICLDDQVYPFTQVWLVAVANFPYYGGGMKVCPEALMDDGLLDICVVHNISRLKLLLVFSKVFKGNHTTHPAVTMLRGKEVNISSEEPLMIHGDGEMMGQTPIEIRVKHKIISVISNDFFERNDTNEQK